MRKAIVLSLLAAAAVGDDSQAAFDALKREYDAAVQEFFRPAREAQAKGEAVRLDWEKHPSVAFVPRFAAFAKEHPKTDAAAAALVMVAQNARDAAAQEAAVATLVRDHRDSLALRDVVHRLKPSDLRPLSEKSPHADVRGRALLRLGEIAAQAGEEKEALALFGAVKEKYSDLPWLRGTLGQRADGAIFEIEHLRIGKPAPEIEGVDLDGKPLRLSDFAGKVVVLDFWGDW